MEEKKTFLGRLGSFVLINFLTLITDKKENISRAFEKIVPFGIDWFKSCLLALLCLITGTVHSRRWVTITDAYNPFFSRTKFQFLS